MNTLSFDKKNDEFKAYFDAFSSNNVIDKQDLLNLIVECGISLDDKRFGEIESVSSISSSLDTLPSKIDYNIFQELVSSNTVLLNKIFEKDLVISNWDTFCKEIDDIYLSTKKS